MADLLARQPVALDSVTRQSFTSLTIDLDPQTEWIEVAIDRPTSASVGIVWNAATTINVRIQVLLDGQVYEAAGRSTGGVRRLNGVDVDTYRLRWNLPSGYFGGETGRRLGERATSTFRLRVGLALLRGATAVTNVVVTGGSSPLVLPTRHNSVAFDNSESAIESFGDGVIAFTVVSTGTDRAALVAIGSRGDSLDGTLTIDGGGETISSALWDVVDAGLAINSRGFSIVNPAAGTRTLTSDLTDTATNDHFLGIVLLTGVHQTAPTGNVAATAPAFDTQPSCTVTGVNASDMVVDFLMVQTSTPVAGADQTEREAAAGAFPTSFRMSTQPGSAGGVMSWTYSGSAHRALNAVVFKANPTAALTGTLASGATEADVVAGGKTIVATLADDTFVPESVISDVDFIANALGGTTTTTSFSITLPTTQAGDLLILEFSHRGTGDGTINGTSGLTWTLRHSQLFGGSAFSGKTYWARATGNHAGQTVTGSGLTNACAAIVTQYRGATASGDPLSDATIVGEENASGNETQAEITTTTDKAMVVLVVANSPDLAVSSQSCTSPGALTERAEVLSTGGTDASISHASAAKATAGATGAFTWAQTNAASGSWAYAIKPNITTPFADARAAARSGLVSAQAEAAGWNARRDTIIALADIVRTSDTVLTATLTADAGYDITAQEVLTWTLPATILTGGGAIVAAPTVTIDPSAGGDTVTGATIGAGSQVHAGTISQTLTGATRASSSTLFAGAVVLAVSGATIASGATLFTGTAAQTLTGTAIASTATLTAGSVALVVTGSTVASTATLSAGTVDQNAVVLGATIASTLTLQAGSLTLVLTGAVISSTATLHAGTVAIVVTGATVAATSATYAGTVDQLQTVFGVAISSTAALYSGTVTLNVSGTAIASTVTLSAGSVATAVAGATIGSTAALSAGTVALVVSGPTIAVTSTTFPGTVAVVVTGATLAAASQVFAGTVTDPSLLAGATITSTAALYPGAAELTVTGAVLGSTVVLYGGTLVVIPAWIYGDRVVLIGLTFTAPDLVNVSASLEGLESVSLADADLVGAEAEAE